MMDWVILFAVLAIGLLIGYTLGIRHTAWQLREASKRLENAIEILTAPREITVPKLTEAEVEQLKRSW